MLFGGHQGGAGAGDGPLGRGGPLAAVAQGKAVLPLGPGEMAGGHGHHPVGIAAAHRHGGQQKALGHGGAGSVEPQVGDERIAQGEAGADALVQQVPGEDEVNVPGGAPCLVQQLVKCNLLHLLLRLLPGFFTEFSIHASDVESVTQGAFGLLFAAHGGPGGDIHRRFRPEGVIAELVFCHHASLISQLGFPGHPNLCRLRKRKGGGIITENIWNFESIPRRFL